MEPFFTIGSERTEVVHEFKYLGGLITEDARMTREINFWVQRMYNMELTTRTNRYLRAIYL